MVHRITTTATFAAAHQLRLYDGSTEPLHGHNWRVKVTVGADKLDAIDTVMDFHDLAARLKRLTDQVHNSHLNDHPAFSRRNPTAENVARWIADALELPTGIELMAVEAWETDENSALYVPGGR